VIPPPLSLKRSSHFSDRCQGLVEIDNQVA
jgi:hypothetical protein